MTTERINADHLSRQWGRGALPPGKDYEVIGEIRSGLDAGGGLWGMPCGLGTPHGRLEGHGSSITRLTRIDGRNTPNGDAFARIQNHSSRLAYFGAYGRDVPTDIRSGTGTKTPYGIVIEGRGDLLGSRFHDIENVCLSDFGKAALAIRGGYRGDSGQWVECPNHGDTCRARIHVANSPIGIFCDNPQAVQNEYEVHTLGNVLTGIELHAGVAVKRAYVYVGVEECTALRIVVTRKLHTYSDNACSVPLEVRLDGCVKNPTLLEIEPGKLCAHCSGVARQAQAKCTYCGRDNFVSDLGSDDLEFSKFHIPIRVTGTLPPGATKDSLLNLNGFNPEYITVEGVGI